MATEKIKVLVVDDASFMVKAIGNILNSDPDIEVVGSAKNGLEALTKIKELKPDIITLDVDMPIMNGITAVRHIMLECPVPIIILSSLFTNGAISFEALRLGVVDFLPKPSGAISKDIHIAKQHIIDRVKMGVSVHIDNIHRVRIEQYNEEKKLTNRYGYQALHHILLLGTTLGGPNTSIRIFSQLSPDLSAAAIMIQETAPRILAAFIDEFDKYATWNIKQALDGTVLEAGTCYVASNETSVRVEVNEQQEAIIRVSDAIDNPLDELFSSAADVFEQNTTGVLLTGIGDDGSNGFKVIREKLGTTIAQNSHTCVYPNLAQCAIERGLVDKIVIEKELAKEIENAIRKQEKNS
ncbi:MAG: response regulator [Methyloprofundus sp.]|nr:response regulator [Methyloprofundus sp.]